MVSNRCGPVQPAGLSDAVLALEHRLSLLCPTADQLRLAGFAATHPGINPRDRRLAAEVLARLAGELAWHLHQLPNELAALTRAGADL